MIGRGTLLYQLVLGVGSLENKHVLGVVGDGPNNLPPTPWIFSGIALRSLPRFFCIGSTSEASLLEKILHPLK